jgi:hypothetical protein
MTVCIPLFSCQQLEIHQWYVHILEENNVLFDVVSWTWFLARTIQK